MGIDFFTMSRCLDRVPLCLYWTIVAALLAVLACCSSETLREYSDEELGVEVVVDDYIQDFVPFAEYRTLDEWIEAREEKYPGPLVGSGHERERNRFELSVRLVLASAKDTLPSDVALDGGVLWNAEVEALEECATTAGWPDVQLHDVSNDVVKEYEREFGLTLEMFLDLRHECSKYAAMYPTLDPAYRDELLAKRRTHYMEAVQDWMADNPHLVVPLEHHDGANQPVEDYWIEVCMETDEPEQCARDNRVTLP